jgi:hypothetical protein
MVSLKEYGVFRDNMSILKELSKDDHGDGNVQYMTDSLIGAVDFDIVKRKYANKLGLTEEVATSVDALLQVSNGVVFVEFKNGKMKNTSITNKIKDSLLIFCDIIGETIKSTRDTIDFVLVYNEEKNWRARQDVQKGKSKEEKHRSMIGKHYMKKANKELILFGLEKYKTLYFREVHTYTESEFENFLLR